MGYRKTEKAPQRNAKEESKEELEIATEHEEKTTSIPKWLPEVLAWIDRIELADSALSYSCAQFQQLCWPKLHDLALAHNIRSLEMHRMEDGAGNLSPTLHYNYQKRPSPIPSCSPPGYILNFEHIELSFLDDRVLAFLKCIVHRLSAIQFTLAMNMKGWRPADKRTNTLRHLLKLLDNRIGQFAFGCSANFPRFIRLFPVFIDHIDSLWISRNAAPKFDKLCAWLTNNGRDQIDDGNKEKMKILEFDKLTDLQLIYFADRIKEKFSCATEPRQFLIHFFNTNAFRDITLLNRSTGELMEWYENEDGEQMAIRCPNGEEDRWKMEGWRKLLKIRRQHAMTSVQIDMAKNADDQLNI